MDNPQPHAQWKATPGELSFSGQVGAGLPAQDFDLRNSGDTAGDFSIAADKSWVTVAPAQGRLAAGSHAPIRVSVSACSQAGRSLAKVTISGGGSTASVGIVRECQASASNNAPSADLAADPTSGAAPLDVTFTLNSSDPDGDQLNCTIDFGDGASSNACSGSVQHSYAKAGNYVARFNVDDGHGGSAGDRVSISATDANDTGYQINFIFIHEPSDPDVRAAFNDAAARWGRVVTRDLNDVDANIPKDSCLSGNPGYQGTIDDLLILVDVTSIDGDYGVLGSAGPCYIRGQGDADANLPYFGAMQLDSADLNRLKQDGTLEAVILHEMGHVLGIGTIWEMDPYHLLRYNKNTCAESDEVYFTGSAAVAAWRDLGQAGDVPVEDSGGEGSKCGHWREATFGNELMTPLLNDDNPLSRVTIGSLADLGYSVDYNQADPYQLPSASSIQAQSSGERIRETLIFPRPDPK